jgi:hypothetical protein
MDESLKRLRLVGVNLQGAILNCASPSTQYGYGGYYGTVSGYGSRKLIGVSR